MLKKNGPTYTPPPPPISPLANTPEKKQAAKNSKPTPTLMSSLPKTTEENAEEQNKDFGNMLNFISGSNLRFMWEDAANAVHNYYT